MQDVITRLREFRDERAWRQFHQPKELAISIAIEAAELLEIFQWKRGESPLDGEEISRASQETADIFIYVLYLCDTLGIDLLEAANNKIDDNARRYPLDSSTGVAGVKGRSKPT